MAATLPALEEAIRQDPAPLRSLTGSLVAILKQVLDQRLPKTYDYHKVRGEKDSSCCGEDVVVE